MSAAARLLEVRNLHTAFPTPPMDLAVPAPPRLGSRSGWRQPVTVPAAPPAGPDTDTDPPTGEAR